MILTVQHSIINNDNKHKIAEVICEYPVLISSSDLYLLEEYIFYIYLMFNVPKSFTNYCFNKIIQQ